MCRFIMLLAMALFGGQVQAADAGVVVKDAWAMATAPGQDSGMIQFSISSKTEAVLVAVSTPVAGAVEIHRMTHENGNMQMRAVESLALPAGKTVSLESEGYHVMLLGLKQPLRAGENFPLSLTVDAGKRKITVEAKVQVRAPGMSRDMTDMGGMEGMHHHGH